MWVLSLICKSLLNILKSGIDRDRMMEIVGSGVVPFVVNLSCQGTGFSNQWLLRDLEVFLFTFTRNFCKKSSFYKHEV